MKTKSNNQIGDLYDIKELIGAGSHGSIMYAEGKAASPQNTSLSADNSNISNKVAVTTTTKNFSRMCGGDPVAIKIQNITCSHLKKEEKIYKKLIGAIGFPALKHELITNGTSEHLVMELLGSNLTQIMHELNIKHFSLKTILFFAEQALLRLQYLHSKGYVHCDIKPDNFVVGKKDSIKENTFHLIDMGLATRYINKKTGEHLPFSDKCAFVGSMKYASTNVHRGWRPSRRDDLESLGYTLVYLMTGSLPWSTYANNKDVLFCKMNTSVKYLCDGLPEEFEIFINSVKCLGFCDQPDYRYYRNLFRGLFMKMNYIYDFNFDWSAKQQTTKSYSKILSHKNQLINPESSKSCDRNQNTNTNTNINTNTHTKKIVNGGAAKKHRLLIYPS